jgi:hypothetical protein
MPRDGSNIYHRPAGTDAVTNTTISSTAYNANVADVEQDLNVPRPIVAGGTGSSNATAAIAALGGEKAKQIVADFNNDPIVPGSFYAATTAVNSPIAGHAFAGYCYNTNASDIAIQVIDVTDPSHLTYLRVKSAGVWGAFGSPLIEGGTF